MTAKYATTCAVCAGGIRPGEEIGRSGRSWAHAACADAAPSAEKDPGERKTVSRQVPAAMPAPDGALEVWTDGACSGNPGPGGWAWATRDGRQDSGGEPATTNQRME